MRKLDSSACNLQFWLVWECYVSQDLHLGIFEETLRHLCEEFVVVSWTFCKELCHILQGSLDSLSILTWFMWYWWFSGLFDRLGTKFYAFPQPTGEIGIKTRWKQRNPAKPKPSYTSPAVTSPQQGLWARARPSEPPSSATEQPSLAVT